jgi:hypothetical protein
MGLMDKMKEQAAQALNKAQQGVGQGKAKIDEAQAKHQWDGLLRDLGATVYAEQREGGSSDAVTAALVALDAQAERVRTEGADRSASGPVDGTSPYEAHDGANAQDGVTGHGGAEVPPEPATGESVSGTTVSEDGPPTEG